MLITLSRKLRRIALSTALIAWASANSATAQGFVFFEDSARLEDAVGISVLDRELVAFDSQGGASPKLRLELGEKFLWKGKKGRLAIVMTDRRLLARSADVGGWHQARFRLREARPESALLGSRIALVVTNERLLGFLANTGSWLEFPIQLYEEIGAVRTADSAMVVVTQHRAIGLSPDAGGFFARGLNLKEQLQDVEALSSIATVTTDQRILVFQGRTGGWEERTRPIH